MKRYRSLLAMLAVAVVPRAIAQQFYPTEPSALDALIMRARTLELDTPYVPPPGDSLEYHTAGYAKIMCSAVFVSGLDSDFAAENVGYATSPYEERARVGKPEIDYENKEVHITLPNGLRRTARYFGDQGCVTLPIGKRTVDFTPKQVESRLPDPTTLPWPMGDEPSTEALPPEIDQR
jgi:hypothetical protein